MATSLDNLVGWWFFFCGVGVLVFGVRQWLRLVRSSSWPAVNGRIIRSNVNVDSEGVYVANVTYEYSVNGQRFECDRIKLGGDLYTNTSRKPAERNIKRYPLGSEALVYYDPFDPTIGCLERADVAGIVITFVCGMFFLLFGLALSGAAS